MNAQKFGKRTLFFSVLCLVLMHTAVSCENKPEPEYVIRNWLNYTSAGECDKALDLEIEYSMEIRTVVNCDPYESEIISITCETREDASSCNCVEKQGLNQEAKYNFDIKKVDGMWKIARIEYDL
ncbi:MAG: hypothetical protein P8I55_07955 [Crocinitomix sp.]|nr:hypothetical protein [Crocinitomix sp.]